MHEGLTIYESQTLVYMATFLILRADVKQGFSVDKYPDRVMNSIVCFFI